MQQPLFTNVSSISHAIFYQACAHTDPTPSLVPARRWAGCRHIKKDIYGITKGIFQIEAIILWPTTAGGWLYHYHSICDMDNVKLGQLEIHKISTRRFMDRKTL
jgi:hypothetical protein